MEPQDRFVPLELDAVPGEPQRHLGWVLATIALCAAMVLLAAGLVPLALAGGPVRVSQVTAPSAAAQTAPARAFEQRTGPAHAPLSRP